MRHGKSLAILLPFVLSGIWAPTIMARQSILSRVYSVTATLSGLVHHPANWVGHTVLVRGKLVGCPYRLPGPCASWQPVLADPASAGESLPVLVRWARPSVDHSTQVVRWGAVGIYRVQLRIVASGPGVSRPTYVAILGDAVP